MSKIYIYALKEIGRPFESIRWIGQTNNPRRRLAAHKNIKNSNNLHKNNWILSINKKLEMIILEEVDELNSDDRETILMHKFKNKGFDLINIKFGGNSCRGWKHKPETILKMKVPKSPESIKHMFGNKHGYGNKGKKFSLETRLKMSVNAKNMTEEHKRNISLSKIGHSVSESSKIKMSKSKIKISNEQIDLIKQYNKNGFKQREISRMLNIAHQSVSRILNGKQRKWIM